MVAVQSAVACVADELIAADVPALTAEQRRLTVQFVCRRATGVPGITGLGVRTLAMVFAAVRLLPGGRRLIRGAATVPLPLVGDYPRLLRSLAHAFIWERWPDTTPAR